MAPEQNKRKQVYNEESDGHLIFAMSFSRFLKSLKKDLCKNQHLSPFTNSNQILTSLSEKRLRKASSSLALYSFSCTCFSSLQKEPKLVITVTPHCMGGDKFSTVFPYGLYAKQKDTSLHIALMEFHHHLLLLTNSYQDYCEAVTH